jgi:ammonium transporter Rh
MTDAGEGQGEKQGLVGREQQPMAVEIEQPTNESKKQVKKKEKSETKDDSDVKRDPIFIVMCLAMQAVFLILFAIGGEYRREYGDTQYDPSKFSLYQDIHGMMFIGFGFLMTFLRRYSFGSIAFNFLLCALCIQWQLIMFGAICQGWNGTVDQNEHQAWGNTLRKYSFSLDSLTDADLGTAAILISMGAVLGRTMPSQLLLMAFIEVPLYAINFYIVMHYLKITDVGGSITIHVFGAYFGLAVSAMLGKPTNEKDNKSMYHSDLFSMIGTLFLWLYWPSFNAYYAYYPTTHEGGHRGLMLDSDRTRAYVNTVLSLCAATMSTFAFSKWVSKKGKLEMIHIQNATLAGGVVMGACADLYTHPAGAVGIGFTAGAVSTFGFRYVQDFLKDRGLYDTCGINNLHGMPGLLGCIASAITVGSYDNTHRFRNLENHPRNRYYQASYQIAGVCVTLGIAIVGGLVTGAIMKYALPSPETPYSDVDNFDVPGTTVTDFFRGTIRGKQGGPVFRDESDKEDSE